MLKLYTRENCPFCTNVRHYLEAQNIPYENHPVPKLGSERVELFAMETVETGEVPVLVDGETVIQGSQAILAHLGERKDVSTFGDPVYGLTRRFPDLGFSDAVPIVKEALKTEGFGVLTEINVKKTLKKKIDVDFRDYVILGACNPTLAHKALTAEPGIGLLLPCNVVVSADERGGVVVSAVDPVQMFKVVGRPDVEPFAKDVRERLARAMAAIQA